MDTQAKPVEEVKKQEVELLKETITEQQPISSEVSSSILETNNSESKNSDCSQPIASDIYPIAPENSENSKKPKQAKKKVSKPDPSKAINVLPKLKILVLHGFQQYLERIQEKIQPWVKFLSKSYDITEVLLPIAPTKTLPDDPNDPFRCWLALNKEIPLDFEGRWTIKEAYYHFFNESEAYLLSILESHPDVNLMINFSQGSLFGSMFLAKHVHHPFLKDLKAVINICGVGLPRVTNPDLLDIVNQLYEEKNQFEMPSLFLIGEKDVVVPFDRTEALAKWYKNKQFLKFDGPHCIPKQKIYMEQVKVFLDSVFIKDMGKIQKNVDGEQKNEEKEDEKTEQ